LPRNRERQQQLRGSKSSRASAGRPFSGGGLRGGHSRSRLPGRGGPDTRVCRLLCRLLRAGASATVHPTTGPKNGRQAALRPIARAHCCATTRSRLRRTLHSRWRPPGACTCRARGPLHASPAGQGSRGMERTHSSGISAPPRVRLIAYWLTTSPFTWKRRCVNVPL